MTTRLAVFRSAGVVLILGCLVALFLEAAVTAQDTSPGGQPLPGAKQSVPDLEEQVAYHRAFEAVVWAADDAFRLGAPLRAVCVVETWPYQVPQIPSPEWEDSLVTHAREVLAKAEGIVRERRPEVEVSTTRSLPQCATSATSASPKPVTSRQSQKLSLRRRPSKLAATKMRPVLVTIIE